MPGKPQWANLTAGIICHASVSCYGPRPTGLLRTVRCPLEASGVVGYSHFVILIVGLGLTDCLVD